MPECHALIIGSALSIARELGLPYACLVLIANRATGRGDTPIHHDVKASTVSARTLAESLLPQFFKVPSVEHR